MSEIIIKSYTDEEYNNAVNALDIKLKLSGKSFKALLIDSLLLKVNDPSFIVDQDEMLTIYEMATEIKNNSPKGQRYIEDFKQQYLENYIKEQRLYGQK